MRDRFLKIIIVLLSLSALVLGALTLKQQLDYHNRPVLEVLSH